MRFALRRLRRGEIDHELIWLAVLAAAGLLGGIWLKIGLPTPRCMFHAITGVPCLTCGATRCARAIVEGDPVAAWAWNPLVCLAGAGAAAFMIYALVVAVFRLPRIRLMASGWSAVAVRIGVVAGAAANWIYLVYAGSAK